MVLSLNKNNLYIDYLVVLLFVFVSDGVFFHRPSPALAFVVFLFVSFFYAFYTKSLKINSSFFIIYLSVLIISLNFIFFQPSYKNNYIGGYLFGILGAYLLISSFDYYYFRKILTNIVFGICVIGIPIYILNSSGFISSSFRYFGSYPFLCFGPFMLGWSYPFYRFAGIFHEPGACQIVLNIVLCMNIDNIITWKQNIHTNLKLLVILLGVLLTQSTSGYICLMFMLLVVAFHLKIEGRYKILLSIFILLFVSIGFIVLFNSDIVQNKLFVADSKESLSTTIRSNDLSALFSMSLERPLLGYGLGSSDFYQRSMQLNNLSSSSGFFKMAAWAGWVYTIIFLIYQYKGIRKIYSFSISISVFILYFLLMNNEDFMEFPISSVFIFNYKSYGNLNSNILYK